MIKELDIVALTHNISDYDLKAGDIGAVVHVHDAKNFEVEFVTAEGETIALLTLSNRDIRLMQDREILHARPLEPAVA